MRWKTQVEITHHILEQHRHEHAAELLAKANNAIFGSGVDLEVEALSSHDVLDQLLALILDALDQGIPQFDVFDKGLGGKDVVVADVHNKAPGLFNQFILLILSAGAGANTT